MESITIIGRRWFNKSCGNTYNTVAIYTDSDYLAKTAIQYGYGSHYTEIAFQKLIELGVITDRETYSNGNKEALWVYCERKGIKLIDQCLDVNRKKDL